MSKKRARSRPQPSTPGRYGSTYPMLTEPLRIKDYAASIGALPKTVRRSVRCGLLKAERQKGRWVVYGGDLVVIREEWLRLVEAALQDYPPSWYRLERSGRLEIVDHTLTKRVVEFEQMPTVARSRLDLIKQIVAERQKQRAKAS